MLRIAIKKVVVVIVVLAFSLALFLEEEDINTNTTKTNKERSPENITGLHGRQECVVPCGNL